MLSRKRNYNCILKPHIWHTRILLVSISSHRQLILTAFHFHLSTLICLIDLWSCLFLLSVIWKRSHVSTRGNSGTVTPRPTQIHTHTHICLTCSLYSAGWSQRGTIRPFSVCHLLNNFFTSIFCFGFETIFKVFQIALREFKSFSRLISTIGEHQFT